MAQPVLSYGNQQYGQSSSAAPLQFYDGSSMYGPRAGHGNVAGPNYAGFSESQQRLEGGWLSAFGAGGYEGEAPLLEELGVNFGHIKGKTLTVLNPLARIDQHIMDDSDMAGPILFCLLFGTFLLLSGKVHFGYVYGVALLGSISLHLIFSMMGSHPITFSRTASMLGYCLLPLVFTSAFGVAVKMDGLIGYVLAALAISWCTYSSSAMIVAVLQMMDMRLLVAYPLALFYSVFALMTIFAEKVPKK